MNCSYCGQPIPPDEKFVSFKRPWADGNFSGSYDFYHNRYQTDCYTIVYHREQAEASKHPAWDKVMSGTIKQIEEAHDG